MTAAPIDAAASRRPLVSVVIPCFRKAAYLAETVSSVALQTFEDWEIIVVDDGSPDESAEVARKTAASLPGRSIRLLEQPNAGVSVARNNGIRTARGEYILVLDGDDLLDPTFLEKTVAALEAHPEAAIAHTDYATFGAETKTFETGPFDLDTLRERNVVTCSSLYRRSVWDAVGGYDPRMLVGYEDWDFWISCAERGFAAVHVAEVLFFYRVKEESRDTEARRHDLALKAQIVLKHPAAYPEGTRRRAAQFLEERGPCGSGAPAPEAAPGSAASPPGSPAVSVVIPCHGQAALLPQAVASVVSQTFTDWELVVVDDGSPDDTTAVAEQLIAKLPDHRVRLVRQENQGLARARNAGVRASRGRLVLPLDADDLLDRAFLERTVAALEAHPEAAIATTDAFTFGASSSLWDMDKPFDLASLRRENQLNYCSLYRRELFDAVGGYNPNMVFGYEDWDFWLGAAERGFRRVHVPEVLFYYRVKPQSMVTTAVRHDAQLRARMVLNHPGAFDDRAAAEARALLEANPLTEARSGLHAPPAMPGDPAATSAPLGSEEEHAPRVARARSGGGERLRILHTVEFYAPHVGGSETVVQEVSERLARRGHSVTVATSLDCTRAFLELNAVPVVPFMVGGSLGYDLNGDDVQEYAQFLERPDWDVAMHYGSQVWPTDLALLALDRTRCLRASVLAPVGYPALSADLDSCAFRFQMYYRYLLPVELPKLDAVVYHSAIHKDFRFGERLGLGNGVVIPNAVSEEEFGRPPRKAFRERNGIQTPHLAVCVANFHAGKRQDRVLAALRAARRDDLTTVFIGRDLGSLERCRKEAEGLPNVRFLHQATREETVAAFHEADLFLFGSETETAPLVVLEAMASRTPFVSTDVGNVRELPGGVVCAPEDVPKHLTRLLDDPGERRRLAEEGHRAWRERFTWERVVDAYEDLYLRLHAARRGPRVISLPAASNGAPGRPLRVLGS